MSLQIEKIITGPIETNTYVIVNSEEKCFIVDPSSGCEDVIKYIQRNNLIPESIIITHGHFDHVMGVPEIQAVFNHIPVYMYPLEQFMLSKPELNGSDLLGAEFSYEGEVIDLKEGPLTIGSFQVDVIVVPGHSPAGIAVLIDKYLICGDILFAGSVGRSDLPGGNEASLLKGIREKFLVLPDETIVCPGHGGRTTIAREKRENPYLKRMR